MPASRSLSSLLSLDRVRVEMVAPSKDAVLASLVELIADHEAVSDADQVLSDVRDREAMMSTGVGGGLALPHARTTAVSESIAALATLKAPIDFDALDGQPVDLVLLLIDPEADRSMHLHVLSRVSRVMSDPVVRSRMAEATSPHDILEAIRAMEATLA